MKRRQFLKKSLEGIVLGSILISSCSDNPVMENTILKDISPPIAEFTATPTSGSKPLEVTFDASGSYDNECKISHYFWDFDGDGKGDSSEPVDKFIYQEVGTYHPNLTIINEAGLIASKDTSIVVYYQEDCYYYYYNEKIPLSLKLDQYAVKFHDEISDDRKLEIFSQNNLNLIVDQPIISGLYLIKTLTEDVDNKKNIENITEVEYVSYCYITPNGGEVYLTNTFFAKFKSNISMENIDSFNKQYNAKIVWEISSAPYYFLLEIPWYSPINTLELSNIYKESGLVEHASPNWIGKVILH